MKRRKEGHRSVVHKGTKVYFFNHNWLPYYDTIRNMLQGPLLREEETLKINNINRNGNWDFSSLFMIFPKHIKDNNKTNPFSLRTIMKTI